ncbi:metal-dependent hydrolase [Methanobacterium oryzae]|uniref:metal-dependent hydrolase n=1 Tax=Methanobacterium oryzae TaxID=69540 RepID=UPI003D1ED877
MPDWITHILVAWTTCTLLSFKFKQFNRENTVIVMIGSLIPDIFKIYIPLELLGIYAQDIIMPIHLPIGSLIMAAIISLFFKEKKTIFLFLIFGVFTHFALDSLLTYVSGGMLLLFPFSWQTWQLKIIPIDDYNIMILALFLAVLVYFVSWKKGKSVK